MNRRTAMGMGTTMAASMGMGTSMAMGTSRGMSMGMLTSMGTTATTMRASMVMTVVHMGRGARDQRWLDMTSRTTMPRRRIVTISTSAASRSFATAWLSIHWPSHAGFVCSRTRSQRRWASSIDARRFSHRSARHSASPSMQSRTSLRRKRLAHGHPTRAPVARSSLLASGSIASFSRRALMRASGPCVCRCGRRLAQHEIRQ
mmetsp:Transcript_47222/g.94062  ORF Transcript_47222/g.94062 Transcript_47222/m.94062 type:complete len:203 (-) Transcript_47222:627-1235(-)